jgi:Domain of unknown function (DUF5668)
MVLIFIGGVFLLQNAGYLPSNAWLNIWRLWPLLLVVAGFELLLAGRVPGLILAALALVVVVVAFIALSPGVPLTIAAGGQAVSRTFDTDAAGASQVAIVIHFGAGQLTVGPLIGAGSTALASIRYNGPPNLMPQPNYSVSDGMGVLRYEPPSGNARGWLPFVGEQSATPQMDVELSGAVPITSLTLQTGATQAHLDLSNLRVANLDVSVGAASTWIRLPEMGVTTAHVNGGAATVTLEIPQGVAAQVRQRGGLSTFNIDQTRFPPAGEGIYRSIDYATAQNKVDLDIETGLTTIQIN